MPKLPATMNYNVKQSKQRRSVEHGVRWCSRSCAHYCMHDDRNT